MDIIRSTAVFSLVVQIITALVDFYVLMLPTSMEYTLLKQLLTMELVVQLIEGAFYVWLTMFITSTATGITRKRYWDWMISTPIMLVTLSSYLIYLRIKYTEGSDVIPSFLDLVDANYATFFKIVILNALMLIMGYLGEINVMNVVPSVMAGFIPFLAMFYVIYDNYAKHSTSGGMMLFIYFFITWAMYGVAALLSYKWKNVFYNMLDLVAKNFFGLFLAYVILQGRTQG